MIIFNLTFTRAIKLMKILALQKEESWASYVSQMSNQISPTLNLRRQGEKRKEHQINRQCLKRECRPNEALCERSSKANQRRVASGRELAKL